MKFLNKFIAVLLMTAMVDLFCVQNVFCQETSELTLYARGAVLMDGTSGRVLYEKEGNTPMPMASTTKVMTLLVALEHNAPDATAEVSTFASGMPETKLGLRKGEIYQMRDLYYAMMLESANDAAVVIAENTAGSVPEFTALMNDKAAVLGCTQTHFVTVNGLDGEDAQGRHETTAAELAVIMCAAIKNTEFLEITQTKGYAFEDTGHRRSFSVSNKNALLDMRQGVLSGKTGFTGDAGYCYVCAVESDDRIFVVALLGCSWPPSKTHKWKDVAKLLGYGENNYELYQAKPDMRLLSGKTHVVNGITNEVGVCCDVSAYKKILLGKNETVSYSAAYSGQIYAPLAKGSQVGVYNVMIDGKPAAQYKITVSDSVESR